MLHEMKLQSKYFDKIKSGEKIYEIRLNDEKRKIIDAGDTIIFSREPDLKEKITTIVQDLVYFASFEEMAQTLPTKKIGFDNLDTKSIVDIYHTFYSQENEKKYGVVAIKVKTL